MVKVANQTKLLKLWVSKYAQNLFHAFNMVREEPKAKASTRHNRNNRLHVIKDQQGARKVQILDRNTKAHVLTDCTHPIDEA